MSECCFVDTTVLTEALLKPAASRKKARAEIRGFRRSILPVYAIKEFKSGPLKYFIWAHNKLAMTRSYVQTLKAIQNSFRRPYQQSTALEALQMGHETLVGSDLAQARTSAQTDTALADSVRLAIRRRVDIGWRERRKITTEIGDELPCFAEASHVYNEQTNFIDDARTECDLGKCCAAKLLRVQLADIQKILNAMRDFTRPEDVRRRAALHLLKNTPKRDFPEKSCKDLGDAYFALRCPDGCVILTSNSKDHRVLAAAVGKEIREFIRPK